MPQWSGVMARPCWRRSTPRPRRRGSVSCQRSTPSGQSGCRTCSPCMRAGHAGATRPTGPQVPSISMPRMIPRRTRRRSGPTPGWGTKCTCQRPVTMTSRIPSPMCTRPPLPQAITLPCRLCTRHWPKPHCCRAPIEWIQALVKPNGSARVVRHRGWIYSDRRRGTIGGNPSRGSALISPAFRSTGRPNRPGAQAASTAPIGGRGLIPVAMP